MGTYTTVDIRGMSGKRMDPPNWSNPLEETSSSSRKKGQINSPSGALTARAIHGSFHCFFLTSSSRSTGVTVQNNAKSEDAKKLTATIDANAASQPPFPFKKNPTWLIKIHSLFIYLE